MAATFELKLAPPRVITSSPWPEPETLRLAGVAGPNCELILFKVPAKPPLASHPFFPGKHACHWCSVFFFRGKGLKEWEARIDGRRQGTAKYLLGMYRSTLLCVDGFARSLGPAGLDVETSSRDTMLHGD